MHSSETLGKIRSILSRLKARENVSFEERVFIQGIADNDQKINSCLIRANRSNHKSTDEVDSIQNLINSLDLCSADPNSSFIPDVDDIGDWFSGAPSWVARS